MNPNRDAVVSSYITKIHACALKALAPELDAEAAGADWVGAAVSKTAEETQKIIADTMWGPDAVRSTPSKDKFDFDADAKETLGTAIVHTRHLSTGFKYG